MTDLRFVRLDMHRIGETVAGMVTGRNFEDPVRRIDETAQDAKTGAAPRHVERRGHRRARRYGLNILGDARDANPGKPLELAKDRVFIGPDLPCRVGKVGMDIGVGQRDRTLFALPRAKSPEMVPTPARCVADMDGELLGQRRRPHRFEHIAAVARILQDFADVRQRLVQRAAARRRWLDHRSRPAPALDQAFALQRAQRLADREAADAIARAKYAFGRELRGIGIIAPQDFAAQFVGERLIARLPAAMSCAISNCGRQIHSPFSVGHRSEAAR